MSSATRDVSIDQLRALPLKRRLQIMEALLESIEGERGPEPISDEFADEPDGGSEEEDEADPPPSVWQEVRTEIRTVFTHYHQYP
jgi:hypothetical protein